MEMDSLLLTNFLNFLEIFKIPMRNPGISKMSFKMKFGLSGLLRKQSYNLHKIFFPKCILFSTKSMASLLKRLLESMMEKILETVQLMNSVGL